ncbi:hypothetical protein [Neobacillus fumarioli]|uniref:hypothetical protein n=1 Tax=Neobacillus fumarioli TaxID=105229 RepID=UPI00082E5A5A|nr:hypothetical protein [Neobacillus fumarioli]
MLASIGILLTAVLFTFIEIPSLLKKQYKKELVVFCILLLCGTLLSILKVFGVHIPNPVDGITFIFKPISEVVLNLLK